jgi:hypothetical protein
VSYPTFWRPRCDFLSSISPYSSFSFPYLADGDFPYVTATADFNNDGREDLVSNIFAVQTSGVGVFDVRLSTGDGTYAAPTQYTLPNGASFSNMTVGDFNNDGSADLAVSATNGTHGNVVFLYYT